MYKLAFSRRIFIVPSGSSGRVLGNIYNKEQ